MNKLVKAVLITTILGVSTKVISFLLKIYISRVIGAEALGYYQISLSAFLLLCTLVSSGIPLVISRRIAKDKSSEPKLLGSGLIVSIIIALLSCSLALLFPNLLEKLWAQKNSLSALNILLPAVVFTAIYVPIRGSFWGNKKFFTLGFIELIEQAIRCICCIILFNLTISMAGENITALTYTIACGLSTLIAIFVFCNNKGKIQLSAKQIKPLVKESMPIAIVRIGTSLVALFISIIFPQALVKAGASINTAVADFGVVTGMVLPMITIPGTVIGSISVAILPELSGGNESVIKRQINMAISYSIILSLVLFPVYLTIGEAVGILLFKNTLSGIVLKYGSFLLLPLGISQIVTSILNALGKEKLNLIISLISSIFLILSAIILPKYVGVYSLLIGFFIMSLLSCILGLFAIKKYLNKMPIKILLLVLLFCIPASLFSSNLFGILDALNASMFISVAISAGFAVGTIFILTIIFKLININNFLPKKLQIFKRL